MVAGSPVRPPAFAALSACRTMKILPSSLRLGMGVSIIAGQPYRFFKEVLLERRASSFVL